MKRNEFLITIVFLALSVAGCAASSGSPLGDPRTMHFAPVAFMPPEPERVVLDNGLVVYLLEDHELPLVTITATIRTGAWLDPAEKVGLAGIAGAAMRTGGTVHLSAAALDQELEQMAAEGVEVRVNQNIGTDVPASKLMAEFDAVVLAGGAETPRDLPVPGRELKGVHFAMEFLPQQNKVVAGDKVKDQLRAEGKHVVVIGGGDTGSDCVGTSTRHGAKSVTQFEVMPMPPEQENKPLVWPYWPLKLRTSSSHDESQEKGLLKREFAISTKAFLGQNGQLTGLKTVHVEMKDGKLNEVPGTEQDWPADLVLLAMGFTNPMASVLEAFGVDKDARGNAKASTEDSTGYITNVPKVFAAGDMRRGQSLVVWAIREGRQAARSVDQYLMGQTTLPR